MELDASLIMWIVIGLFALYILIGVLIYWHMAVRVNEQTSPIIILTWITWYIPG